jgi:hypothetical protein
LIVGEVNNHFVGLVDGVFARFDSIDADYWKPATVQTADLYIFERDCPLGGKSLLGGAGEADVPVQGSRRRLCQSV